MSERGLKPGQSRQRDFLDEVSAERAKRDPAFTRKVYAALRRREAQRRMPGGGAKPSRRTRR